MTGGGKADDAYFESVEEWLGGAGGGDSDDVEEEDKDGGTTEEDTATRMSMVSLREHW